MYSVDNSGWLNAAAGSLTPPQVGQPLMQLRNSWASVVRYPDRERFSDRYVGPCPLINDDRIHSYRFELFALDVKSVPKHLSRNQVLEFIKQHAIQSDKATFLL